MKRNRSNTIKRTYNDKIFDIVNIILVSILGVIFIWPLWFVVIASFSDAHAVIAGEVLIWPKGFTLDSYKMMFEYESLWRGYLVTIIVSTVGTAINLAMSVCCAYPLSCKDFALRKIIMYMLMVTMYFGGGMIPTYMVVRKLGLLDSIWAMIVPGAVGFSNCLIIRSYMMSSIPGELKEASMLDGANAAQYLWKIVLPLSKPVLAVVGLYYLVGHWNNYMQALLYIYDTDLYPLQTVLRILLYASTNIDWQDITDVNEVQRLFELSEQMKYSVIIAASVPVLCIYPFIQKFFVKGVMIGSLKG